jgi:protein SCO1/2
VARLAVAIAALALLWSAAGTVAAGRPARLEGTVVWPPGLRPAPPFALHDQNGRLITRSALLGHTSAITFLDSKCRASCPVVGRDLAVAQRLAGRSAPLQVIVVSVLPGYDTPAHVRAFAHKVGLVRDWHWLLGTRSQLGPVWQAYGIWVQTGITHDVAVYIVDCKGDVRVADAQPVVPSQVASSTRALQRCSRTAG